MKRWIAKKALARLGKKRVALTKERPVGSNATAGKISSRPTPFASSDVELDGDPDRRLMADASRGDRDAFRQLYEKFKRPVLSYVYYLVGDRAAAEELAQEVFLKAYRARAGYEPRAKFSTWLWTIARNTAFDHLRSAGGARMVELTPERELERDGSEPGLSDPERILIEQADREEVRRAMLRLSDGQRETMTLRIVAGLSYEQIASVTGMSVEAAKSLVRRGKDNVVRELTVKATHA
jgi:RNA polymerase sigma-70 factor, ECF subfamily